MTLINRKQFDILLGFYTHCYCVYHDKVKQGFAFWSEQLDAANIPWSVQNTVANLADDKSTQQKYLRTLLLNNDINVGN
jgi:hypothetical protein